MHTDHPPREARSRHSRRPTSLRAIDRNGHMDSTCTSRPPHRARSPHSRHPANLRTIDRNGHMDSTCTSHPPHRAHSPHSRHPASLRAIDRNGHMDNNRLPRLPAPSADTRMTVRAANLATRSRGSLKPNLSASACRAHERPRAGPRPRARRKPSADAPRRTVDRASVSGLRLAPFIRPTSRALSTGIHAGSPVSTAPPFSVVAALSAEQHCRL